MKLIRKANYHLRIVVSPKPEEINDTARRLLSRGRGSMGFILGNADQRSRIFLPRLRWDNVILAIRGNTTVGIASFKCNGKGGPYVPSFSDFYRVHGLGALWRYVAFRLTERRDNHSGFYLYGVRVIPRYRGQGIARNLLDAVRDEARKRGARYIELEVTESNPGAQNIYARYGYVTHKVLGLGWLGRFFGYSRVTVMRLPLD